MEWGTNIADELGLECFLTSSAMGTCLCRKAHFIVVDSVDLYMAMSIPEPSDEWEEFRRRLLGDGWYGILDCGVCLLQLLIEIGITCGDLLVENSKQETNILGRSREFC